MRIFFLLAAAVVTAPFPAVLARPALAGCPGFFNASGTGYKLQAGGHLELTNETVSAGTTLKFKRIGSLHDISCLTRSRSDIIQDAQNIEVTAGCYLRSVDLTRR